MIGIVRIRGICTRLFEQTRERLVARLRTELVDVDTRRDLVDAVDVTDELLENRSRFGEGLLQTATEPIAALGLRLLAADIKDIMFPGELKKIFAQVVQAKQEGLAALERARGETAALRNLANAARAVKDNPALLQLRMLQAIGGAPGSTLVVGLPGVIPVAPKPEQSSNVE